MLIKFINRIYHENNLVAVLSIRRDCPIPAKGTHVHVAMADLKIDEIHQFVDDNQINCCA